MATLVPDPADLPNSFGLSGASLSPLPGDASTRRYARATHPDHGPCLVLADEPGTLHFENFLVVGAHLRRLGFSVPEVFASEAGRGLALIEDFGTTTFSRLLAEGHDETALYDLATDTLVTLHQQTDAAEVDVPAYDLAWMLQEVSLLPDWFAPATGFTLTDSERETHQSLWSVALADVSRSRAMLVLRDFHIDNLMLLEKRTGIRACGLLDFQGALIGSPAYDLMSLTQDARRDLSPGLEERCLARYLATQPTDEQATFIRQYHLLAAQRHAKVAGIFHRLNKLHGKSSYLEHLPRVLRLLDRSLEAAGLTDIRTFLNRYIPTWRR